MSGKPKECRRPFNGTRATQGAGQRQYNVNSSGGGAGCVPCPGKPDAVNNNDNNGDTAMNQLRARFSQAIQQSPKINVEAEVDRLVGAARCFCDKEKFKLKQYYEEEIRRTKKVVIQEFKCAMEKEIIAPMKSRLCAYEKEIQNLKRELETACRYQQQASYESKDEVYKQIETTQLERDLLDAELEKAHSENRDLQHMMKTEVVRKAIRNQSRGSIFFSEPHTNLGVILSSEDAAEDTRNEGKKTQQKQVSSGGKNLKVASGGGAKNQERRTSKGPQIGETEVGGDIGVEVYVDRDGDDLDEDVRALETLEVHEDTQKLLDKIKDLTESIDTAKKFTEEEILDFIREGELMEAFKQKAGLLEVENEELRRRIEELLKQLELMKPTGGSVEDENMSLRKRIQELESSRAKGSLEAELEQLRKQLAELQRLKAEQEKVAVTEGGPYVEERVEIEQIIEEEVAGEAYQNLEPDVGQKLEKPVVQTKKESIQAKRDSLKSNRESAQDKRESLQSNKESPQSKRESLQSNRESLQANRESMQAKAETRAASIAQEVPPPLIRNSTEAEKPPPPANQNRDSSGSEKSQRKSSEGDKEKHIIQHEKRCSVITAGFEQQIKDLQNRINELEDQLQAFGEMEKRIRELEAEVAEMDALRKRIAQLMGELEELRNVEPPVCEIPEPDDTENRELREKLGVLESQSLRNLEDIEALRKRAMELERENEELKKKLEGLAALSLKADQLEAMHAQMLEEKRRKSEQCLTLQAQVNALEAEKARLTKELEDALKRIDDLLAELAKLRDENGNLRVEVAQLREKAEKENLREQDLMADLKNRNAKIEELQADLVHKSDRIAELMEELRKRNDELAELKRLLASLEAERDGLKRQVEDLTKRLDGILADRANMEAELANLRRQLYDVERKYQVELEEQARKCAAECSVMSRKGQCILEHEKKCLALTGQLEEDNILLQERIKQLEKQVNEFFMMENRTRMLHTEMEELQSRAADRTKQLDELKNMASTCQIGPASSDWEFSKGAGAGTSVPWPKQDNYYNPGQYTSSQPPPTTSSNRYIPGAGNGVGGGGGIAGAGYGGSTGIASSGYGGSTAIAGAGYGGSTAIAAAGYGGGAGIAGAGYGGSAGITSAGYGGSTGIASAGFGGGGREGVPSKQVDGDKRRKSTECKLLASQLADLEAEKKALNHELSAKLREVDQIKGHLDGVTTQNTKLRQEVNTVCESARENDIISVMNEPSLPSTVPTTSSFRLVDGAATDDEDDGRLEKNKKSDYKK